MAKKLYGGTNLYCEVLKKYAGDGWAHYDKELEDLDDALETLNSWQGQVVAFKNESNDEDDYESDSF